MDLTTNVYLEIPFLSRCRLPYSFASPSEVALVFADGFAPLLVGIHSLIGLHHVHTSTPVGEFVPESFRI